MLSGRWAPAGWAIAGGVVLSGLMGVAALLWWQLPRWAPEWVEEHSPWLDPLLRAAAVQAQYDDVLDRRLRDWPGAPGAGLTSALDHPDARVRWIAATCLAHHPYDAAMAPLLGMLGDPDLNLREAARSALPEIHAAAATPLVIAALVGAQGQERKVLLDWLASNSDWTGLGPVLSGCDPRNSPPAPAGVVGEYDGPDAWLMAERLRAAGQARPAAAVVVTLLAHPDAGMRIFGIGLLRTLGTGECARKVAELLIDADEDVRLNAGDALLEFASAEPGCLEPAVPWLLVALAPQPGPSRRDVVRVLAALSGPRIQQALAEMVHERTWDELTRAEAITGLAHSAAPGAVAALAAVLASRADGDGPSARVLATRSLAGVHAPAAVSALVAACDDPVAAVRSAAIAAVADAGDQAVDAALLARLGDVDEAVRAAAIAAIVRFHPTAAP